MGSAAGVVNILMWPFLFRTQQEGWERGKAALSGWGGLVVQLRVEALVLFCMVLHVVHQVNLFLFFV